MKNFTFYVKLFFWVAYSQKGYHSNLSGILSNFLTLFSLKIPTEHVLNPSLVAVKTMFCVAMATSTINHF